MLCILTLLVGQNAIAQNRPIEEVVVIVHPLSGEGLPQAADVLIGEELNRKRAANIGATLAIQPQPNSTEGLESSHGTLMTLAETATTTRSPAREVCRLS